MIVSVSGFNYTGSSAVVDLLKEYAEPNMIELELALLYLPDGLLDLDYHLNRGATYFNGDAAIGRYWNLCKKSRFPRAQRKEFLRLSRDYLDALAEERWRGNSSFDGTRMTGSTYLFWTIRRSLAVLAWHFFHYSPGFVDRTMYLACHPEQFKELTGRYLCRVAELFAPTDGIAVFNQFFSAFQPEMCMQYTPDAKTIIVDRDPRDVYILGKKKHETHCYPTNDVKKFVAWYRRCWEGRNMSESDRVLRLQFEDIVYHYEESVKQVELFLGIEQHVSPREHFDPDVSINNTQLKERFPNLAEDIAYIEKTLSDYLYPFPEIRKGERAFF